MNNNNSNTQKTMSNSTFSSEQILAINKCFYYLYNCRIVPADGQFCKGAYVPEVIAKAKYPSGNLYIIDKFVGICERSRNVADALINFYGEIDNEHREVMLKWIGEHYEI